MWTSLKQRGLSKHLSVSSKEKVVLVVKSVLVIAVLDYCFYRSFWMLFPLLSVGVVFYQKEYRELMRRKKEQIRQQFKEMLVLTVTGQKAGYSVENAFLRSYEDLAVLYGIHSSICSMLRELKIGLENHLSVSELWSYMGESCGVEEIIEFSEVFSIAKKSGGNMTVIMERTVATIESRAETQKEIETLLSARKLEQRIMNVMPVMLMIYINITSPGYFSSLYYSFQGIAVMTFCLSVYLAAYLIGVKLSAIEV